jgi:hypothetical protein
VAATDVDAVGIQFERLVVRGEGALPIPVVELDAGQRRVPFGEGGVDLDGFLRGLLPRPLRR